MAEFTTVSEADAPRPRRQGGRLANRMREYEDYVKGVRPGRVGKLTPSQGETARAIALRVSRAARRINKSADTWIVDNTVYFKVS
jgi:hypothetical protein